MVCDFVFVFSCAFLKRNGQKENTKNGIESKNCRALSLRKKEICHFGISFKFVLFFYVAA